jgi:hypothetical protein
VTICPACGYPTIGLDLCPYCRPVEMLTVSRTFEPMLFASKLRHGSASVETRRPGFNPAAQARREHAPIYMSSPHMARRRPAVAKVCRSQQPSLLLED